MRGTLRRLLALLVLSVCATGCGGGGGQVAPDTWAGSVCTALHPWRDQITSLNAQAASQMATATTPQQTRDNMLRLLDGARLASERARAQVAAAGVPDVPDGQQIAGRFVAALAAVRDAYRTAHDTVAGFSTREPKAFYDGVSRAVATLNTSYARAGVDTGRLASADLRASFARATPCR
ncbi:MAG: hypothetical protein J2P15_23525 [Micromonosporaceae bacterium]|nr:hypothetical protein [Micromonosporaceae bacterium]